MHILIVDDEPDIVDTLKVILEAEGFEVTSANSGDEAFEKARVVKPDVIFSDVVMGRMSGIDLAILANKVFPGCRTILCSGQIVTTALLRVFVQPRRGGTTSTFCPSLFIPVFCSEC